MVWSAIFRCVKSTFSANKICSVGMVYLIDPPQPNFLNTRSVFFYLLRFLVPFRTKKVWRYHNMTKKITNWDTLCCKTVVTKLTQKLAVSLALLHSTLVGNHCTRSIWGLEFNLLQSFILIRLCSRKCPTAPSKPNFWLWQWKVLSDT